MLRFLLDKLAFCGFRLTLPEIFESENRHGYFTTCLFVIPCSVDITLLELSNWSWILSTSFCTFSSVTSRLLAVDFAIFSLTSFVLCTSVLQCFLEAFGLFPRLITNLSSLPFCLYCCLPFVLNFAVTSLRLHFWRQTRLNPGCTECFHGISSSFLDMTRKKARENKRRRKIGSMKEEQIFRLLTFSAALIFSEVALSTIEKWSARKTFSGCRSLHTAHV